MTNDVPDELVLAGLQYATFGDEPAPALYADLDAYPAAHVEELRAILAAVLPEHEKQIRAQVSDEQAADAAELTRMREMVVRLHGFAWAWEANGKALNIPAMEQGAKQLLALLPNVTMPGADTPAKFEFKEDQ